MEEAEKIHMNERVSGAPQTAFERDEVEDESNCKGSVIHSSEGDHEWRCLSGRLGATMVTACTDTHRVEGKVGKRDLSKGRGRGGPAGKGEQDSRGLQDSASSGQPPALGGCGHWKCGWSEPRQAVSVKHTPVCEVVFYINCMPK